MTSIKDNPYPGIDLGQAYQYFMRLKDTDLSRRFKSIDLIHAIGYAHRGGRVSRKLNAFRQFGLVKFDGNFYTFTKLGKNLLSTDITSPKVKEYALQAARTPELYKLLYLKTNGKRDITLSDTLVGVMANYDIKRSDMKNILNNYNETLKFVDLGITSGPSSSPFQPVIKANISKNAIQIDFSDNLIIEIPKDFILKAALHDLAKNGPTSSIRLISDKNETEK